MDEDLVLLCGLRDFFEISPMEELSRYYRLTVKVDIVAGPDGQAIAAGDYYIDEDLAIYGGVLEDWGEGKAAFPIPSRQVRLVPLRSAAGTVVHLPDIVYFIGEYMDMPPEVSALFDGFFDQGVTACPPEPAPPFRYPEEAVEPCDNVTRHIFSGSFQYGLVEKIRVSKRGKKVDVTTLIEKMEVGGIGCSFSEPLTPFDQAVCSALFSLWMFNNYKFTVTEKELYVIIGGNNKGLKVSDEMALMIDESWQKCATTLVTIDLNEASKTFNTNGIKSISAQIIVGTRVERDRARVGHRYEYTITEKPVLLSLAEMLNGQILRYPIRYLDTQTNNTPELIPLKRKLLHHILTIPRISNRILYGTLFEDVVYEAPTPGAMRQKKLRLKRHVHKWLDAFKEYGVIAGWHEEGEGTTKSCIVIERSDGMSHTPEKPVTPPGKTRNATRKNP